MPISRINPDGTVKIYNSKTKQVLDVRPEELADFNPALVDQYQAMQSKLQLSQQGVLDVSELAKTDPALAQQAIQQGAQPKKALSAEQQKRQTKYDDLSQSFALLEQTLSQIPKESRGRGAGDISLFLGNLTGGNANQEVYNYEQLRKALIGPVARAISGETGVLTDKDIARAEGLLPRVNEDPKASQKKLENVRTLIGERTGQKPQGSGPSQPTTGSVVSPQEGPSFQRARQNAQARAAQPQGLIEPLLAPVAQGPIGATAETLLGLIVPNLKNVAKASGAGANTTTDQKVGAAGDLAGLTLPFAKLGLLGKVGAAGRTALAGGVTGATEPGQDLLSRLTGGGIGAATGLALGKAAEVAPAVRHPLEAAGAKKAAAIAKAEGQGVTISGDNLLTALKKAAQSASPTNKAGFDKYLGTAEQLYKGKTLPINDATNLLTEANTAFTSAGKVGKAAAARFNKVLGDAIRSELKLKAPDVAKANDIFKKLYGIQDVTKKVGPSAIVGGALGAVGYGLGQKILGR